MLGGWVGGRVSVGLLDSIKPFERRTSSSLEYSHLACLCMYNKMYTSIIMGCHLLPCIPTIVCTLKRIDEHSLPLPQALKEPPPEETGEFVVHCKYAAGWMK